MKHRNLFMALALIPFAFGIASVQAQPSGKGRDKDPDQKFERMLNRLDLSAEQKDKISDIRSKHREKLKTLHEKAKAERSSFRDDMSGDKSSDELRKAHEAMIEAHNKVRREQFELALAIRSELTPEQRAQMEEFRKSRPRRFKDGRGGQRGRRGGLKGTQSGPPQAE